MSSSREAFPNNQQGGKQVKKNKNDLVTFVKERLAEINATMFSLTCRIADMDECIMELESRGETRSLKGRCKVIQT